MNTHRLRVEPDSYLNTIIVSFENLKKEGKAREEKIYIRQEAKKRPKFKPIGTSQSLII